MNTKEIVREIEILTLDKKVWLVQEVLKSIRRQEINSSMKNAAESLYEDYKNDSELTAFTNLDFENFYETK